MLTKERRSLYFDKLSNRLSKRSVFANSGAFDRRLVSLPKYRHRANASACFVDHFLKIFIFV
jgi:hypothetical protein